MGVHVFVHTAVATITTLAWSSCDSILYAYATCNNNASRVRYRAYVDSIIHNASRAYGIARMLGLCCGMLPCMIWHGHSRSLLCCDWLRARPRRVAVKQC